VEKIAQVSKIASPADVEDNVYGESDEESDEEVVDLSSLICSCGDPDSCVLPSWCHVSVQESPLDQ